MAPFVPAPRAVRDIDRQLRHVARRATVHAIIADSLALLVEIEVEQDSLLELRCAEAARRT
jgi:hypothetical protein